MLEAYAQSPARDAPNARIVADFWSDQQVQQLPYQRGRFLMTIWDAHLRAEGRSLDQAVREMRERARGGDPLKATEMFPVVLDSMGLEVRADIESYAEAGARVLLPEDVFAPCGRVVTQNVAAFDAGFDIPAMRANNRVISSVDPSLPAYAAGLRNGMVFVRQQSGHVGDPEQQLVLIVRDGGQERTISYFPRGHGTYAVQRLDIDPALEGERLAQCRTVLGGV